MAPDPYLVRLGEQRDAALADLRDLEAQVDRGEIAAGDAAGLRTRYETAATLAIEAIEAYRPDATRGRSGRRVLIGLAGFIAAAVAVTVTLLTAVEPRPEGGFVTGGVARDVLEGSGVDLSSVTNEQMEQVVAANPEILPMRLALARRYLEEGAFGEALGHYMFVLERETHPEALMYVGWMTYLSGDAPTARALVEQSLAIDPDEPLAQWFQANILMYGVGDARAAVPLLEAVIASGTAPDEIVAEAERMVDEATR